MHETSNNNQNLNIGITREIALQAETKPVASVLSSVYLRCFGRLLQIGGRQTIGRIKVFSTNKVVIVNSRST
jgi:hypothetical protein